MLPPYPDALRRELVATLAAAGCVWAEDEAALLLGEAADAQDARVLVERRAGGEPLELVLGWAELDGTRVATAPGVFVPRRRSELLVAVASQAIDGLGRSRVTLLELCAGSGAVAAALQRRHPGLTVHATDIDPRAVELAGRNLPGSAVHVGDLYDAVPAALRGRVDVLVANAPYVPTGEIRLMPVEAREHEPRHTLDGGPDGVELHRRIAAGARDWLCGDAVLLVETSEHQAEATSAAFEDGGLVVELVRDDDLGATVAVGRFPG